MTTYAPGDTVRVRDDAPHDAGHTGVIDIAQVRDGMHGYWVLMTDPRQLVWIPAAALDPVEGGEQR